MHKVEHMNGEFSFKCCELSRSGRQIPDQSKEEAKLGTPPMATCHILGVDQVAKYVVLVY